MQEHQQEEVDALEQIAGDLRVEKKWYRQPRLLVLLFLTLVATLLLFAAINSVRNPATDGGEAASSTEPLHSIPPTMEQKVQISQEFNQRVLELGQTMSASMPQEQPSPVSTSSVAGVVDGPLPVVLPLH